jgi:uncharacterized protein YcbX
MFELVKPISRCPFTAIQQEQIAVKRLKVVDTTDIDGRWVYHLPIT